MMTEPLTGRPGATTRTVPQPQDEAEFEALFLAHYQAIYRLLYSIVGSRTEAEDLAQETFLKLHQQRFAPDRQHNLRAWLYRVAANLAYNSLRSSKRRQRRQEAVAQDSLSGSAAPDPAQLALRTAEQAMVRRVLTRLPERQSKLLLLRHAGLSYKELAEALEVAPSSVGSLLARAHAAFEAAYWALEPDNPPPTSQGIGTEGGEGRDH